MNYTVRENCIFCNHKLTDQYFKNDLEVYTAHYAVEDCSDNTLTPYNVYTCDHCKTPQNKYLGDLNEIYRLNHADSTGTTMKNLHLTLLNLILEYKDDVGNIIEIGSSKGILADLILQNLDRDYYAVEPRFTGNESNKTVVKEFYENVDDSKYDANTMIMSHVFEHFYNPKEILLKISKNKNIENLFLIFPNLEYYAGNNVVHVLNTEHTFYIDNNFLCKLFNAYGFEVKRRVDYKNHSVILYFTRTKDCVAEKQINFKNLNYSLDKFYSDIFKTILHFNTIIEQNKDKEIYLFPASVHLSFLFNLGLSKEITGLVDNSINKIGKKMYGTDIEIFSFNEITSTKKDAIILLNGGVFNKEVESKISKNDS